MTGSVQAKSGKLYMVINEYIDGKRKQKWIPTGLSEKGNKRRAEEMLHKELSRLEAEASNTANVPFAKYIEHWLPLAEKRVDIVTYQNYFALTKRHILPWFQSRELSLADVDYQTIQAFLDEKLRTGRLDGKGGLSEKSVRELKNILNLVFKEALREGLIVSNPCELLRLPPKAESKAKFYTEAQLNQLLELTKDEVLYPIIKTAIVYGMRRSEILGLQWSSLDFENNSLTVQRVVVSVYEKVEKDKTKTKSSHRSFPLYSEMREMFLGIRAEQEENRRLFGKGYIQSDYVFCWPDGHPISSDYVSHRFGVLLKKNGMPPIRFHDLRHSCASLLLAKGCNFKEIQAWMGHSDIGTTMNIYSHLDTNSKLAIADKMAKSIQC